jgi:hypothetical protein
VCAYTCVCVQTLTETCVKEDSVCVKLYTQTNVLRTFSLSFLGLFLFLPHLSISLPPPSNIINNTNTGPCRKDCRKDSTPSWSRTCCRGLCVYVCVRVYTYEGGWGGWLVYYNVVTVNGRIVHVGMHEDQNT